MTEFPSHLKLGTSDFMVPVDDTTLKLVASVGIIDHQYQVQTTEGSCKERHEDRKLESHVYIPMNQCYF